MMVWAPTWSYRFGLGLGELIELGIATAREFGVGTRGCRHYIRKLLED